MKNLFNLYKGSKVTLFLKWFILFLSLCTLFIFFLDQLTITLFFIILFLSAYLGLFVMFVIIKSRSEIKLYEEKIKSREKDLSQLIVNDLSKQEAIIYIFKNYSLEKREIPLKETDLNSLKISYIKTHCLK